MFEFKRKPKKKGEPDSNPLAALELDADTESVDEFLRESKAALNRDFVEDRQEKSSCGCW